MDKKEQQKDKLDIAVDICMLTQQGWTFDIMDNAFGRMYAKHTDGRNFYFSNDQELVEWLEERKFEKQ